MLPKYLQLAKMLSDTLFVSTPNGGEKVKSLEEVNGKVIGRGSAKEDALR